MASELVTLKSVEEATKLSQTLATSRLLPEALQKNPADILATILAGAELGMAPMQSVRAIVIIKGKPTLSADAMGALVKRSEACEYLVLKLSDEKVATWETKRRGDPSPTTMSFTIQDAQRAGLVGGDGSMYKKYPAQMLRARCLAAICRAVYPDVCLGLYDPDELEADPRPNGRHAEKEVTPAPNGAARTVDEAKAKLKEMLGVEDAQVVPEPTKPAEVVNFGDAPWERIQQIGRAHGYDAKRCGAEVRRLTGKSKTASLTADDVEAFRHWADDIPPEGEPPFPSEQPPEAELPF